MEVTALNAQAQESFLELINDAHKLANRVTNIINLSRMGLMEIVEVMAKEYDADFYSIVEFLNRVRNNDLILPNKESLIAFAKIFNVSYENLINPQIQRDFYTYETALTVNFKLKDFESLYLLTNYNTSVLCGIYSEKNVGNITISKERFDLTDCESEDNLKNIRLLVDYLKANNKPFQAILFQDKESYFSDFLNGVLPFSYLFFEDSISKTNISRDFKVCMDQENSNNEVLNKLFFTLYSK